MLGPKLTLIAILSLPEPIALSTHVHADMDGAASIYALQRLLKEYGKDAFPLIFSASAEAKRLRGENRDYASAVIVDTHKPSRCPVKPDVPKVVIDHHQLEETRKNARLRIDPSKASTSEMIALMFREWSLSPPEDVAEKLLLGIMADTRNFLYASRSSFEAAAYLREFTKEPAEFFHERRDVSAVIASLKAAKRAEIFRAGDRIVVVTHVSAHESKAASDLVHMGADAAIVYSDRRVVVRSREPVLSVAKGLGFEDVGGHEKAFVIKATDTQEAAMRLKDALIQLWRGPDETKKR